MLSLIRLTILLGCATTLHAATDIWELPPLKYSDREPNDTIAQLGKELADGTTKIEASTPLGRLRFVLDRLNIAESSQILVFSKTSKQNDLINPANPRSLYFNENAYVGYVPGGDIEVIAYDANLGAVFYMIQNPRGDQAIKVTRDKSDCMSCHGTARTENVPGVLVRSVFPDDTGQPRFSFGSFLTDHSSPIPERWGGYYVTGRSSLPHMGNRTYPESSEQKLPKSAIQHKSLENVILTSRYLTPTSDIVALMVLEHQCQLQNKIEAAKINYKRLAYLSKSLNPDFDGTDPTSTHHINTAANGIVDLLLFKDEAPLGPDGIEGNLMFQNQFTKRFPKSKNGRSLADFRLHQRIFKYRCSYMVYSESFKSLPKPIKSAVQSQLNKILTSEPAADNFPDIHSSERRKILTILTETIPDWPKP